MRKIVFLISMALMMVGIALPASATPPQKIPSHKSPSVELGSDPTMFPATEFEMKINAARQALQASTDDAAMSQQLTGMMKAPTPEQAAALESLNMRGLLYKNMMWRETPIGIYTVPTNGGEPEKLGAMDYDFANGLVDMGDGTLCAVYYKDFGRGSYRYVYFYDTTTWEVVKYNNWPEMTAVSFGCALDPTSGEVYGVFFNETGSGYNWAKADWDNWQSIAIAPTDITYMSVGCTSTGQFYGISTDGKTLYAIDKATGTATPKFSIDIPTNGNPQGGCINTANNTYLQTFANTETYEFGLMQIDLETGEQTLVCNWAYQYYGIYIPAPEADAKAPNAPVLAVACNEGAMSVDVTLTMPTTLYDGSAADGMTFSYTVKAGEAEILTGTAATGEVVQRSVAMSERGNVNFTASVSNEHGASPVAKAACFVGKGSPAATASVSATWADGQATLTWDPVTSAIDEGYINPADITYTITSDQGAVVAQGITAATYTFALPEQDDIQICKYGVKAVYGDLESDITYSNSLVVGSYKTPMLMEMDYQNENNFYLHTFIDANNDESSWESSDLGAKYRYHLTNTGDDWLFSPGIKLEAGKTYTFKSKCRAYLDNCPEKVEIFTGTSATIEGMTIPLVPVTTLNAAGEEFELYFTAPETAVFYIGFHAVSDPNMFYLFVSNYSMSDPIDVGAPAAVTDAKVTPYTDGQRKAVISYTAPTKTVLDTDIIGSFFVRVFRGDVQINSQLVAPGQEVSFEDEAEENGTYDYRFVTYMASGDESKDVTVSALIGPRIPENIPGLLEVEQTGPDAFLMTWQPVTKDTDGNPLVPENITYKVYTGMIGDGVMPDKELGTTTETTFTYVPEEHISEQGYFYLVVAAYNMDVRSKRIAYARVFTGDPYEMPVTITDKQSLESHYYTLEGTGSFLNHNDESLEGISAYDNDNAYFAMLQRSAGMSTSFVLGQTHISGENPVLSFYIYSISAEDLNETTVYAVEDGVETELAFRLNTDLVPEAWNQVIVDLSDYVGKDINIKIKAKVVRYQYNMYDLIELRNNISHDLSISATMPSKAKLGEEFNVNVTVANQGSITAPAYTVNLLRDGEVVESRLVESPLVCGETATLQFAQTFSVLDPLSVNYSAEVVYDADLNADNNKTPEVEVVRSVSKLPGVTGLRGENSGNEITISWDEFKLPEPWAEETVEDIEQADAYAHSLEGWTFLDLDRSPIGGFQGHTIPGIISGTTKASFFVFTSDYAAGLDGEELFYAHSGKQYLVSFFRADDAAVNDWAVSPLLSGEEQTISFYAKSFSEEYPNNVAVSYTTSDDASNTQKYVEVLAPTAVPFDWTLYSVQLPAGATHFAIRSCTIDGMLLMVDDIKFNRLEGVYSDHLGFNVYFDGAKAHDGIHTEGSFTHKPAEEADAYTYHVTTVFEEGESELSEPLVVGPDGLAALGAANLKVMAANGSIIVAGADGKSVSIAMVDGKVVYNGIGDVTIHVVPSVYLVTVNNITFKLLVK